MLGVGFLGCAVLTGLEPAFKMMVLTPYNTLSNYTFTVVPLFILMGNLIGSSGLARDIFGTAHKWVGWLPGGVAQATMVGGAIFGALSGSSMSSCAALGTSVLPEMERLGVNRRLSVGVIAAAASLDPMIPPSVSMVIYAVITEQSVGKLLIAGILPGILACLVYMILIFVMVKRDPKLAPSLAGIS
jgi:tripartite ATP-independent transporter DctM subunit